MEHFLLKTIVLLCSLAAVLSAQTPVKDFRCEPDNYCGPSGGIARTVLKMQVEDGYQLLGWDIKILRKSAPDSFFAQTGLPVSRHQNAGYDSFVIAPYQPLPKPAVCGEFPIAVPLKNFTDGDYTVLIVGCFQTPEGKRTYWSAAFFQTIASDLAAKGNDAFDTP